MESKQVLSIEQMQHLQELGLKLKPSLVHYYKINNIDSGKWYLSVTTGDISHDSPTYSYIPAYTLQDVLDELPKSLEIGKSKYEISIYMIEGKWAVDYYSETDADIQSLECENLIDAVYSRLCWAIDNKFVETNKNE